MWRYVVVCAALLWAGEARGQVREVGHEVVVSARGGVARYEVRRSFHNEGERAGLELMVRAPYEAAVTGLRVASGRGGRVWVDGRVAPAGAAVAVARVRHALCGEGPASCVVSERRGRWPGVARYAYVGVDIRHPRPADLVVTLIDPAGEPYVVHDRAAGVELSRLSARLERRWAHGEGVWALRIEDHGAGEAGALRGWRIGESAEALRVLGGPGVVIPSGSAVDGASVRIEVAR